MPTLDPVALAALPIGTSNAQAYARNAADIDTIVNGTGVVPSRTGKALLSIDEATRRIGYETPVTFASGISVSRATQTVVSGGLTYHANPASLPFTTTGTFNAAQWMLVSNVTLQDLASTAPGKGASLIGLRDAAGNWASANLEDLAAEVYAKFGAVDSGIAARAGRQRYAVAGTTQTQIQTWLDADLHVDLMVDSLAITSPLVIGNSRLRGLGVITNKRATLISVAGNHAAIQDRSGAFTSPQIENLFIDFGENVPPLDSTSDNKFGLKFSSSSTWPEFARFENIIIRGARYGIYDTTGTYQTKYANIFLWNCARGVTKHNGTTILFENVFCQGGYQGWDVRNTIGVTMTNCAADQMATLSTNTTNSATCYFEGVHTLHITGWDAESNSIGPWCAYMKFVATSGTVGMTGFLNTMSAGTGEEVYFVQVGFSSNLQMTIRPVRTAATDLVFSGTGAPYTVVASGATAKLALIASTVTPATGGSPSAAITVAGTSGADVALLCCTTTGTNVGTRTV